MPTKKGPKPIYLAPSDMTGLFQECPRCYVLKVRHGVTPPKEAFPPVVNEMRASIKRAVVEEIKLGALRGIPDLYGKQMISECLGEIGDREVRVRGYADLIYTPGASTQEAGNTAKLGLATIKLGGNLTEEKLGEHELQLNTLALAAEETLQKIVTHVSVIFAKVRAPEPGGPVASWTITRGVWDHVGVHFDVKVETMAGESDSAADMIRNEIIPMLEAAGLPESGEKCSRCKYINARIAGPETAW